MSGVAKAKKRAGRPELPVREKRDKRIELRVTQAEKQQLEQLCEQSGLTMTTLLLDGALRGVANLPQFQRLPADVLQSLTSLQQVAGRLFSYAHRLDQDECTQQRVRRVVFELSRLGEELRQQLEQSAIPRQLIDQLKKLRDAIHVHDPNGHQLPDGARQILILMNDVLKAYEKTNELA